VHSVTVIASDGITTEGLTKSVFVLGPKEGMRLIESQPGVDAIVIDAEGRLLYSSGLRQAVRESSGRDGAAAPVP
jgi:thiamine biosynthesis lipoprotein